MPRSHSPDLGDPADRRHPLPRRAFLGATAAVVAPTLLPSHLLGEGLVAAAGAQSGDDAFAASAAALERALVTAYEGVVPVLPQDLAPIAQTYLAHHRDHAAAWAELAGGADTGVPDEALVAAMAPTLAELSTAGASIRFAWDLEERAVATYLAALGTLTDPDAIALAATIVPVDATHAVTLADIVDAGLDAAFPNGSSDTIDPARGLATFTGTAS